MICVGLMKQDVTIGKIVKNLVGTFNVQTLLEERENKHARRFKVLVIFHAEALTPSTQDILKELMEKYSSSFRVILHTNNILLMDKSLQTQCLLLYLPRPSLHQVNEMLQKTLQEKKQITDTELCTFVAEKSDGNIALALSILQNTCENMTEEGNQRVFVPSWILTVEKIITLLTKTPAQVAYVSAASMLSQELLGKHISPSFLISRIIEEILKSRIASFHVNATPSSSSSSSLALSVADPPLSVPQLKYRVGAIDRSWAIQKTGLDYQNRLLKMNEYTEIIEWFPSFLWGLHDSIHQIL